MNFLSFEHKLNFHYNEITNNSDIQKVQFEVQIEDKAVFFMISES